MKKVYGKLSRIPNKLFEYLYRTNERATYYFTVFPFEKEITRKISDVEAFNIDLHGHTVLSDGENTPHYNVWKAMRRKLEGVAITDHDTVIHFPYCKHLQKSKMATKRNFVVMPGTEYTTTIELENNKFGIAHIVGLSPTYEASKPVLKLVERTKEVKKPQNFLRYTLNLGNKDLLPSEEVIEILEDENYVIDIAHAWTNLGVRGKLKSLLEKYPEACVEVYNPRAKVTFPNGIPDYVIKHGHMLGNSDSHMARQTIGDAFTKFDESDVYGSNGKPCLETILEAMRKGRTSPYLVPLNPFIQNSDKWRFAHVLHDMRSLVSYFDDENRIIGRMTNEVLVGNEIENIEDHRVLPIFK